MNTQEIKTLIMKELPYFIQTDEEVRRFIVNLGREHFADKDESARRFDRMMDELAEQRRQSDKKWEAHYKADEEQWKAHYKADEERWKAHYKADEERWKAHYKSDEERWKGWEARLKADEQRWESHHQDILLEIKKLHNKYEGTIGALGARWGLHSEASFRNALAGILEDNFNVKVINVNEFDDEGIVFGNPDQVELDIIIKNGLLIICEIKSSMSKSDMYIFGRKVRFYEKKHGKQADKMIVISPMIHKLATPVAKKLGIRVYSYAEDVDVFQPDES
jgi:hypothetical protein